MGGGSKTTTTTTVTRTPEEIEYTKQQIELAKQQLALIDEEHGWQSEIYAITKPLLEKYALMIDQDYAEYNSPEYQATRAKQNQLNSAQLDSAIRNLPIQDELLQRQLDEIRRGGAATDEQKRLIADVSDRALASGETDVNRFLGQGLDQIRNQMAPARGMRPNDAPMIDAAQRVLEEATRQQGQLTNNIRGAQAQAELNFPLNAGQVTNQWNQWQQGFNQDMNQFLSGLNQQARQNRTALMGQLFSSPMTASENGLNLINASRPNPVNFTQNTTTTQKQSGGSILGGVGGLLSGVGSLYSSGIFSSRQFKTDIKPLEAPPGHMLSPGALKQDFKPIGPAGMENPAFGNPQTPADNYGATMAKRNPYGEQMIGAANQAPVGIHNVNDGMGMVNPPKNEEDALSRIAATPVSSWTYKPETGLGGTRHVGPMAEDFNTKVMGKGPEPFINTVDAFGSLMASVKALEKRTRGMGFAQPKPRKAAMVGRR